MKKYCIAFILLVSTFVFGQKKAPDNWQLMNPESDKVIGIGSEEAYKLLKDKTSKKVIVAVIDGGVDIEHEDLKNVIWTNVNEIPDNGIDDDKNGYVDDVHGWSFIGGKNGDINYEATEVARNYHRLNNKYKDLDTNTFSSVQKNEYAEYLKIKTAFLDDQNQKKQQLLSINVIADFLLKVKKQGDGSLTKESFNAFVPQTDMDKRLKRFLKLTFAFGLDVNEMDSQISEGKNQLENMLTYNSINTDSIRSYMVGDDLNNNNERYYGNNHVKGPDALHGTHVAGIIAAIRDNNIGIKGVANNVEIMVVRAVPNGDERDKDIANAIYYAVNNGATIINMSFGKDCSPDKKNVEDAVKYAVSKDVLLVHAAGNESANNDLKLTYPNRVTNANSVIPNWVEVGASSYKPGKKLIGAFSNYSKNRVDLFAPGVDIYSTVADNKYKIESGTSMAAPVVTGVAAVLRGYFPELKAEQIREVLMKTVFVYNKPVEVPGLFKNKIIKKLGRKPIKNKVSELCISGGIVNLNNAVIELLKFNSPK